MTAVQIQTTAPEWFDAAGDVVGQTFVGDRNRLHVADVEVVGFNEVRLSVLCGAGSVDGVDVSTNVINALLDPADETGCRDWWAQKCQVEPDTTISRMLPGGLRRPRMCSKCEAIRDGC